MKIKAKKKNVAIGILSVLFLAVLVRAAIPDNLAYKIENSTDTVFTVDKFGHVNATGNLQTDLDLYVDGNLICTDCVGDEDVSDTLTANDLVAGGSVVADSEVDNDLTLSGGSIDLDTTTFSNTLGGDNITANSIDGGEIDESTLTGVPWTGLTGYDLDVAWSNKLNPGNISQAGASSGEVLEWDGSKWAPATDNTGAGGNTTEEVQDAAWDVTGGTQTRITVTYQDATGDVDFVVDDLGNTSAEIQAVSVGGEASGTVGSITLSNTALDDQYVDDDGDTMTGDLAMDGANVNLNGTQETNVTDVDSNSYFYYDANGALVVHLES